MDDAVDDGGVDDGPALSAGCRYGEVTRALEEGSERWSNRQRKAERLQQTRD